MPACGEPIDSREVATAAASSVERPHTLGDVAAQQLIEQVNVDVTELLAQPYT